MRQMLVGVSCELVHSIIAGSPSDGSFWLCNDEKDKFVKIVLCMAIAGLKLRCTGSKSRFAVVRCAALIACLSGTLEAAAQTAFAVAESQCHQYMREAKPVAQRLKTDGYPGASNVMTRIEADVKRNLDALDLSSDWYRSRARMEKEEASRKKSWDAGNDLRTGEAYVSMSFANEWAACMYEHAARLKGGGNFQGPAQVRPGREESAPQGQGQQSIDQSIALAQQNQAKGGEQARKMGRKEHRPDLDAKACLQLNPNTRMIRNACSYKIEVTYCALNPKPANNNNFDVTWAFSCTEGKGRFGADTVGAGKDLFGLFPHRTDGGLFVAACREEYPKDVKFSGSEITYQCRPI